MMLASYTTYYLSAVMHAISFIFLIGQLCTPKKGLFRPIMLFIVPAVLLALADDMLQLQLFHFLSFFWSFCGYFFILPLFNGSRSRKMLIFLMIDLLSILSEFLGQMLVTTIFGYEIPGLVKSLATETRFHILNSVRLMLGSLLMVLCVLAALLFGYRRLHNRIRGLWMMLLISLTHLVFLTAYYRINRNEPNDWNNFIQLVFQLLLFTMLIYQYYSIQRTNQLLEAEHTLRTIQNQRENEYRYYKLADSKFTDISKLRHDIQNQMQTVRVLMHSPDGSAQAERILGNIEEQLNSMKAVNYCENPTINAVLTVKLHEERCQGIQTDIMLQDCDALPFDDYDLCSLVSNLFDNAVEGCQGCEDPFVEMRSGIRGDYFLLRLTNRCRSETISHKTTKTGEGHGYGLQITEEICRKYHGSFTLETEGDTAVATAALALTKC